MKERLRVEMERKESQLEEKRDQLIQAKSEVDRVMGELTEARQRVASLNSHLESTSVSESLGGGVRLCVLVSTGAAEAERDPAGGPGESLNQSDWQCRVTSAPPPPPTGAAAWVGE